MSARTIKAAFTEPMLLLPARELPEGANWAYELKLDGYRALAVRTGGRVHLRSRNNKDFNARYPAVVKALGPLQDETVVDGGWSHWTLMAAYVDALRSTSHAVVQRIPV